jgi:hypothetical protein
VGHNSAPQWSLELKLMVFEKIAQPDFAADDWLLMTDD